MTTMLGRSYSIQVTYQRWVPEYKDNAKDKLFGIMAAWDQPETLAMRKGRPVIRCDDKL